MNDDLEFPYIYDDKEDYYTNIDYTSDVTFGKYKQRYIKKLLKYCIVF